MEAQPLACSPKQMHMIFKHLFKTYYVFNEQVMVQKMTLNLVYVSPSCNVQYYNDPNSSVNCTLLNSEQVSPENISGFYFDKNIIPVSTGWKNNNLVIVLVICNMFTKGPFTSYKANIDPTPYIYACVKK